MYTYLPASVAKRRVASLWHVVGVWSATGRQFPGANGRGRGRGGGGAQIQHGLLGETLPFRAWAVFHLHTEVKEEEGGTRGVGGHKKGGQTKRGEWIRKQWHTNPIQTRSKAEATGSGHVSYSLCPDPRCTHYLDENVALLLQATEEKKHNQIR